MNTAHVARHTRTLLSEDRTGEAIEFLRWEAHGFYDDDLNGDVNALEKRWKEVRDQEIRGTLALDQRNLLLNRLRDAVLSFLEKLLEYYKTISLDSAQNATDRLNQMVAQLRTHPLPGKESRSLLQEWKVVTEQIDKSYTALQEAILAFLQPGFGADDPEAAPYLAFERGSLTQQIEEGRGHCHLIQEQYAKPGGIREQFEKRAAAQGIPAAQMQEMDRIFVELGEADLDIFRFMAEIGQYLEGASTLVVDLLGAGQVDKAKEKIRQDRKQLRPFEEKLKAGLQELNRLRSHLGI